MNTKRENSLNIANIIQEEPSHTANKEESIVFEEHCLESETLKIIPSNKYNSEKEKIENKESEEEKLSESCNKLEKERKENQEKGDFKESANESVSENKKDREGYQKNVNRSIKFNVFDNKNSNVIEKEQNEVKKEEVFNERASDVQVDKSGVYNIKDSGSGDSLLIGTDVYDSAANYANAFIKGIKACPEDLEIPGHLTDSSGKMKPVEIIGRGAFASCGDKTKNGKTKRLKVPQQVKVIKYAGLAEMFDLEVFEIEAGSVLETIEQYGLHCIGYNTVIEDPNKRAATLILPFTLSSVFRDGIYACNIFDTIIYCGSHLLSNYSTLEDVTPMIVVKVTDQYPSGQNIFGRSPNRNSQTDANEENECKGFLPVPTPFPTHRSLYFPLKYSFRPILALTAALLSFYSFPSLLFPSVKPSLSPIYPSNLVTRHQFLTCS